MLGVVFVLPLLLCNSFWHVSFFVVLGLVVVVVDNDARAAVVDLALVVLHIAWICTRGLRSGRWQTSAIETGPILLYVCNSIPFINDRVLSIKQEVNHATEG